MRRISRRIPLIALLLTTALSGTRIARADEPTLVLAGGAEGERVFGKTGSVVLSAGSIGWQHQTSPGDAGSEGSSSTLASVALNADVFVTPQWSLGVGAAFMWSRASSSTFAQSDTHYSIAARLGRAVPLGRFATLWPQLGLGFGREPLFSVFEEGIVMRAALDLPLLFHPTPHLFMGAGPALSTRVARDGQQLWLSGRMVFGATFG